MVTEEMITAFIATEISNYTVKYGTNGHRRRCKLAIEAALSAEAFGFRDALKQTRAVYEGYADVEDALNYLELLFEQQGS